MAVRVYRAERGAQLTLLGKKMYIYSVFCKVQQDEISENSLIGAALYTCQIAVTHEKKITFFFDG